MSSIKELRKFEELVLGTRVGYSSPFSVLSTLCTNTNIYFSGVHTSVSTFLFLLLACFVSYTHLYDLLSKFIALQQNTLQNFPESSFPTALFQDVNRD